MEEFAMKISGKLRKDYPLMAAWIEENLPQVAQRAHIMRAFRKYAELNKTDAATALTLGTNPTIDYAQMSDANGDFLGKTFPETVFIAQAICDRFESSPDEQDTRRMRILIESTVLHEMVHWGDWKDGVDQGPEEGVRFERAAYGRNVQRYW
jgi:hypothetical protein